MNNYGLPPMTEVVKNLLVINVLVFIAVNVLQVIPIEIVGMYSWNLPNFQPYQTVTHMFAHGGAGHLFFNMFALWMFGSALEQVWGPQKMLIYYLATGLGAGLLYNLTNFVMGDSSFVVGASGAVFGLLLAFGLIFPNMKLHLLFPPITVKAKYLVGFYAILELALGIQNSPTDNIAHFAHLGGMIIGFILLKTWGYRRVL